eukprot:TRINITY_DN66967_c2_g1_i1.p1 TRINITY_DN66967_c2_g1~~TRINITY_DN66967_c2_g1_i1.p1  ORF type:complete len:463 (+),score=208.24 TRINITY_DN66967_c2_g1_i1:2-1390(+)
MPVWVHKNPRIAQGLSPNRKTGSYSPRNGRRQLNNVGKAARKGQGAHGDSVTGSDTTGGSSGHQRRSSRHSFAAVSKRKERKRSRSKGRKSGIRRQSARAKRQQLKQRQRDMQQYHKFKEQLDKVSRSDAAANSRSGAQPRVSNRTSVVQQTQQQQVQKQQQRTQQQQQHTAVDQEEEEKQASRQQQQQAYRSPSLNKFGSPSLTHKKSRNEPVNNKNNSSNKSHKNKNNNLSNDATRLPMSLAAISHSARVSGINQSPATELRTTVAGHHIVPAHTGTNDGAIGAADRANGKGGKAVEGDEHPSMPVGWRVLIIDDLPLNRKLMHRLLSRGDFKALKWTFDFAETAEVAWERLMATTPGSRYDLMIVDQNLGGAGGQMLGHQFTEKVRRWEQQERGTDEPRAIMISCTGNVSDDDVRMYMGAGFDTTWGKPVPTRSNMWVQLFQLSLQRHLPPPNQRQHHQ